MAALGAADGTVVVPWFTNPFARAAADPLAVTVPSSYGYVLMSPA